MKNNVKILFTLFIILFQISNVKALSVDKNNLTLEKGNTETIDIYANVSEEVSSIEFTLVYTTYDVPAYFIVNADYTDTNPDGIKHNIVLPEPTTGKIKLGTVNINVVNNPKDTQGTINLHSANAKKADGQIIRLNNQNINVVIGSKEEPQEEIQKEETTQENLNLLEKIESEIVKIDLKENVFEYKIIVNPEITELDLKPITKEENYKVEISSQKIEELVDDTITITVKKDDLEQQYKIKVEKLKEVEDIKIDSESTGTTYKYKGKWVVIIIVLTVIMVFGIVLNQKK